MQNLRTKCIKYCRFKTPWISCYKMKTNTCCTKQFSTRIVILQVACTFVAKSLSGSPSHKSHIYKAAQKFGRIILYALTLPNINRFSQLFHNQNQEKFVIILLLKIPPHPKCVSTLPCEMSSVLKTTIENKTTSVTTHFKKLITGNNVFIVSVIV